MISVILYGRNDSYGYNLHKRAALSLNCIAELLDAPDDELIFVDYNTPDDFPTFPEAIRDTLTETARRRLRVMRVRPAQHRRFATLSHLVALEPVARNVAVRRSNPANRWLLSTNTDMIFVPRTGRSLSAIAAPLADGYYHLARCELPESLWETLDRSDARDTIETVGQWGWQFHLNELTTHELPYLRFDAPGDFQLMLREDAHRIWSFDERMLVGYHVDSNIAARLYLLHKYCGDVEPDLFGYHCDHTRQVTPAHRHDAVQNDVTRFVFDIADPFDCRHQAETWGLAGEEVEEIRLDGGRVTYFDALEATITTPMQVPTTTELGHANIERTDYDPRHVLPFAIDALVEYPRASVLGWFGTRADTLHLFAAAWRALGFTGSILVPADAPWLTHAPPGGVAISDRRTIVAQAHLFVLDGGLPAGHDPAILPTDTPELRLVIEALARIVSNERRWMPHRADPVRRSTLPLHLQAPRRLIGLNGFLNTWELAFGAVVGAAKSPGSTRVRQGFVLPNTVTGFELAPLYPANASRNTASGIRIRPLRRGIVLVAVREKVPVGDWRLELDYTPSLFPIPRPGPLKLEVLSKDRVLASGYPVANGLQRQSLTLDFTIPEDPEDPDELPDILVRVHTVGLPAGHFTAARVATRAS
ncbi:MAG: hypothetical protein NTY94_21995 [Alphaproteobacteria bacterium]|nr:hypothetical protein [Alphaproteobacteria bacterium]